MSTLSLEVRAPFLLALAGLSGMPGVSTGGGWSVFFGLSVVNPLSRRGRTARAAKGGQAHSLGWLWPGWGCRGVGTDMDTLPRY